MPRPKKESLPKLRRDRNRAFCEYKGKRYPMGAWGSNPKEPSPEAKEAQRRFHVAILQGTVDAPKNTESSEQKNLTIAELTERFFDYHDSLLDDVAVKAFRTIVPYLVNGYGNSPPDGFTAPMLLDIRDKLRERGLCRRGINNHVQRLVRIFKWGALRGLIHPSTWHGLTTIPAYRKGELGTFDHPEREPIADAEVAKTLPFLPPTLRTMVIVERLTALRPTELCSMRVGDIDTSGDLWVYRLTEHKTFKTVGVRLIPLGKPEQELLAPFLRGKKPSDAVFSPRQTVRERKMIDRCNRQTSMTPSQKERDKVNSKKPTNVGEFYKETTYRQGIFYALKAAAKAGVEIEKWFPYRLRHAAAEEAQNRYGYDGKRVLLGHTAKDVTSGYGGKKWERELLEKMARERKNPFVKDE